ncbi:hypothetical protein CXF93_03415 [Moritella sp. Urea-trap-13]|nr:hypothetical protein CXF93_03415 [Moritella sp. Urea-trap-13]
MKTVTKIWMMLIVISGVLSACSSDPQGTDGYFEEPIDNNDTPYIYPHPLGNSNTYLEMREDTEEYVESYSAFNYPYGNSATHLDD